LRPAAALPAVAAREFTDDAGRKVRLPDKVERVYAAGPPASVLAFALAPDTLIGWTRAFRGDEVSWVAPRYAQLPELGRLTGRGNTANVEVVLKAKPDVIIDVGSTAGTFASLADRVQEQTRVPYVLLDGRLDSTVSQIEKMAAVLGVPARGKELAEYAKRLIDGLQEKIATVPKDERPQVYYARGPQGLTTGLGGSINVEMIEFLGAVNVAGKERGGLTNVGSSRSCCGTPRSSSPTTRISIARFGTSRCGIPFPPCARSASTSLRTCRSAGSTIRPGPTG
jgi:iron complex transport system substrate-binding protein